VVWQRVRVSSMVLRQAGKSVESGARGCVGPSNVSSGSSGMM